jgi:hypothetical protein
MQTSTPFFGRKIMQNMIFTVQLDNYLSSAIFCKSTGFRPKNRWIDFPAACLPVFNAVYNTVRKVGFHEFKVWRQ